MDSDEISAYLSYIVRFTRVNSAFVVARNELSNVNISKPPVAIVVNTDDRWSKGQHWCAFYVNSKRHGYFFDSYKNPYYYYNFDPPFQIIKSNSKVLQTPESDSCGYWSLLWLYYMSKGKNLESRYSKNLKLNDKIMLRDFNKKFKPTTISFDTDFCQTCCSRLLNNY